MKTYELDKIDIEKKDKSSVSFQSVTIDENLLHNVYLVFNNQKKSRFVSSFTKSRSDFTTGGAKPYKQKGTGRARQGTIRSPLKVGGSVIFGPKPRLVVRKTNKKHKISTINQILLSKLKSSKVITNTNSVQKLKDFKSNIEVDKIYLYIIDLNSNEDISLITKIKNLRNLYFNSCKSINLEDVLRVDEIIYSNSSYQYIFDKEQS